MAESVEVTASHIGMGVNPAAWYVLADRLAQHPGRWRPFHRDGWIYEEKGDGWRILADKHGRASA